jgi:predicted Zn-dependent peptidase
MPIISAITSPRVSRIQSNVPVLGGFSLYFHGAAFTETPGFRGVSHLSEHLLADAFSDLGDDLSRLGLAHNASTDHHNVNVFATGLTASVHRYVEDILLRPGARNILSYVPSRESFERERAVVIQEYETYLSQDVWALIINIRRKFYNYYDELGYDADLKALTYENFMEFFESRFRQPTGIVYTGDVGAYKEWLEPEFWNRGRAIIEVKTTGPNLRPEFDTDRVRDYVPQSFSTSDRKCVIGDWFEVEAQVWEHEIIQELWNNGSTESAPLMGELRHRNGLCYSTGIVMDQRPTNLALLYVTTAPENVARARALGHDVLRNWERHITRERFNLVIEGIRVQIQMIEAKNFSRGYISRFEATEDAVLTTERLETFTYERACEIMSGFGTMAIHRAETGAEIILD